MEKLKKEYDDIVLERTKVIEEINELKENEFVKKYLELNEKNKQLHNSQNSIFRKLKLMEYDNCDHLWIISKKEFDSYQRWTNRYFGCLKCGYDRARVEYILDTKYQFLSIEDKCMLEFFKKMHNGFGVSIEEKNDIYFDLDFVLVRTVYKKIKEAHPRASDKTIIKLLEKEIDKIKNDNVSKNGNKKRTKNLK